MTTKLSINTRIRARVRRSLSCIDPIARSPSETHAHRNTVPASPLQSGPHRAAQGSVSSDGQTSSPIEMNSSWRSAIHMRAGAAANRDFRPLIALQPLRAHGPGARRISKLEAGRRGVIANPGTTLALMWEVCAEPLRRLRMPERSQAKDKQNRLGLSDPAVLPAPLRQLRRQDRREMER